MEQEIVLTLFGFPVKVNYLIINHFKKDIKITSIKLNGGMFNIIANVNLDKINDLKKQIRRKI